MPQPHAASFRLPSSLPRSARRQYAARPSDHADDGDAAAPDAGDRDAGVEDAHADGDDGADDGDGCGYPCDDSGRPASRPGFPLQSPLRSDFRCNLRFAPISAAIPVASARSRSLRAPLAEDPDTPCRPSGHRAEHPLRSPRAGASRSARRGPRLARAGRLRRLRASPRLGAVAPRASPVPASPRTGLRTTCRTARCACAGAPAERARTSLRTSADTPTGASGSVLRTTACGSVRTDRHSIAVAAPLRRLRRRRFPLRSCRSIGRPDRPGRLWISHPTHR